MKKSLINGYTKNLGTLLNDKRITFTITGNFSDKCLIAVYWCNNQVLHNFTLFNDSSVISYDDLINNYHAIMLKHPTKQVNKQLFSLRYNSVGYCSLAITDGSNLELFGVSHKRISKKLAHDLYNYVIDVNSGAELLSCHTNKYINSLDFNRTLMFKL